VIRRARALDHGPNHRGVETGAIGVVGRAALGAARLTKQAPSDAARMRYSQCDMIGRQAAPVLPGSGTSHIVGPWHGFVIVDWGPRGSSIHG